MKAKRITDQIEAGQLHSDVKWRPITEKPINENGFVIVRYVRNRSSEYCFTDVNNLQHWKSIATDWAYLAVKL